MKEKEIWKTIENFADGKYEVSSWGRVRHKRFKRILKQWRRGTGYMNICLSGYHNKSVHRLVAIAFIPNPDNLPEVDHIDCDRSNNYVGNLRWVTPKQNSQHTKDVGHTSLEDRRFCKPVIISREGVEPIRFTSLTQCAKYLKTSISNVKTCVDGHTQTAKGWSVKYDILSAPKRATIKQIEVTKEGISVIFNSVTEASKFLNVSVGALSAVANGSQQQVYGYTARYL